MHLCGMQFSLPSTLENHRSRPRLVCFQRYALSLYAFSAYALLQFLLYKQQHEDFEVEGLDDPLQVNDDGVLEDSVDVSCDGSSY